MNRKAREHSDLSLAVATAVRAERAALKMSREQVCERAGIALSTYRRIETGERVATIAQVGGIAAAFGMKTSKLITLAEERAAQERDRSGSANPSGIPVEAQVAAMILKADLDTRREDATAHPEG